jgi:GTPase SAR1 family protein
MLAYLLYEFIILAVGKSALLTRFSENVFLSNYTSTIGIDFNSRMIRVEVSIITTWNLAKLYKLLFFLCVL